MLKKHSETDNAGEMIASLRNTMFSEVIEEIDEIIEQSEIEVNEEEGSDEEEKKNGNLICKNDNKQLFIEESK